MRPVFAVGIAAALMLTCNAAKGDAQTSTAQKRRAASSAAAAHRAAGGTGSQEGLAAAGTMPAVTGPVKTLYALRYVDLKTGTGELAENRKFYTVHYTGWTTDGKKFDSSFDHDGKEPIVFPVGVRRVIIGWDSGFEGRHVGGKRHLIVPYQLAYGAEGRAPVIPAKADLIFDVELLAQSDAPPQQPAPPAAAPAGTGSSGTGTPPAGTGAAGPNTSQPQKPAVDPASKPAAKPE